jgi:hypothetical protein
MTAGAVLRGCGALTLVAALGGALPGEVNGCDTDLTDEVDHVVYCQDRCAALCERVVTCGLYVPPDDAPDGATPESLCEAECGRHYSCSRPQLCDAAEWAPDVPYVSEAEAEACLTDWADLSCDLLVSGAPNCGNNFGQCPVIETCKGEVLCDPPEWE